MSNFFRDKYPKGLSADYQPSPYRSLVDLFETACHRFDRKPAFSGLGQTLSFGDLEQHSRHFAAYLQNETGLRPGDRIAIQLPNILPYPVAIFGAMRAGLVVVNTNPLYTAREMRHQFNDSGAKALVVLETIAATAQEVVPDTDIEEIIVVGLGDLLPMPRRWLTELVVKYVQKRVPAYDLPQSVSFRHCLATGSRRRFSPAKPAGDDLAVLQYTGGTTGLSKGAMLTHDNILANIAQTRPFLMLRLGEGQETVIAPLPLYHIYSFTVNCGVLLESGNHSVLIPNPRDMDAFIAELKKWQFTVFLGINTLFVALCQQESFRQLRFNGLKMTVAGGMALTEDAARHWRETTGCVITEGYGMTESSPVISMNPANAPRIGTIGLPVPGTEIRVINDEGEDLPLGESGELLVRGPQVMKGYWQKPEESAETLSAEGWLHTGDIVRIDEDGYLHIVDRKKDMILVSGFNVYPNEVENVVCSHPKVLECAAVGIPDAKSGEVVKVFVVRQDKSLGEQEVIDFCRDKLTGYKVPKAVEFRADLPKTNVGKILRRALRPDQNPA